MGRRIGLWQAAATLFTVVNLVGLGMAMAAREQMHSGIHVLLSLVGGYAMWYLGAKARRAESPSAALEGERLEQLQQSVDAIALEVERIGEAQRFHTKLQSEQKETAR
jgi:membrane protein YqaA with SNARE-associated domain